MKFENRIYIVQINTNGKPDKCGFILFLYRIIIKETIRGRLRPLRDD